MLLTQSHPSLSTCSKVRAQLGLRPLDVGGGSKKEGDGEGEGEEGTGKREDVHAPAKNLGAEKSAQKVGECSDVPPPSGVVYRTMCMHCQCCTV